MKLTRAMLIGCLIGLLSACSGGGGDAAPAKEPAKKPEAKPAAEAPAEPAGEPGNITVTVAFEGAAPERTKLDRTADPFCAKTEALTEDVIVNGNSTLKNVVVRLKKVKGKFDAPADAIKLSQNGCAYAPHVQAAMKGQAIEIVNGDATLHNVHSYKGEKKKNWFNVAQPPGAPAKVDKLKKAELATFKCDVHPWMSAYVLTTEHPFVGVTGDEGTVALSGVPSKGKAYEVIAWHETFGEQTAEALVEAGKTAEVKITFKAN